MERTVSIGVKGGMSMTDEEIISLYFDRSEEAKAKFFHLLDKRYAADYEY